MGLAEIPEKTSGSVTLKEHGSFYAAIGLAFRDDRIGDFQFSQGAWRDETGELKVRGDVCACRDGQRGLVELGDHGSTPLSEIGIVPFGYTQRHVALEVGNVYIVKGREGLEGHFVVFRVDSMTEDGITISYLFR